MSYSYNTSSGGGGYALNPYSGGYTPRPYTYADQQNNDWGQRGKASFNLFEGNGQYDESEYDEHEYYEQQEENNYQEEDEQEEDNYQEDDQEEEEEEEEEEDNQGDDQDEDDADYDDGINYGTCSSPNCTNICHPEASDRCPICAPRAYDLPQFRYCEAVLVHEVYPSIDEDPYYGYDRGYKYVNNPGAHVDNSKPGDLSLTEDEIFCNHPGCYNTIIMQRYSYCLMHRQNGKL